MIGFREWSTPSHRDAFGNGEDFVYSCGTIATIRQRLSAALAQPMNQAIAFARQQPVAYVVDKVLRAAVETGAPMGHADGGNPDGKRGWQWV